MSEQIDIPRELRVEPCPGPGIPELVGEVGVNGERRMNTNFFTPSREDAKVRDLVCGGVDDEFGFNLEDGVAGGCTQGLAALVISGEEQRQNVFGSDVGCEIECDRVLNLPTLRQIGGVRPGREEGWKARRSKASQSFNCDRAVRHKLRQLGNHDVCVGRKGTEGVGRRVGSHCLGHGSDESVYGVNKSTRDVARKFKWPCWGIIVAPFAEERECVCTDSPQGVPSLVVGGAFVLLALVSENPGGEGCAFVCGLAGARSHECKKDHGYKENEQTDRLRGCLHGGSLSASY